MGDQSRSSATAVSSVTVLLFFSGIAVDAGRYSEAAVCSAAALLVWTLTRQHLGNLQAFWTRLKRDLGDTARLTGVLLVIVVIQLLFVFSPFILFGTVGQLSDLLIVSSNEIVLAIAVLGIGGIFAWTILRYRHERIELLDHLSRQAAAIAVLFTFSPTVFVFTPSTVLLSVGVVLFLAVVAVRWLLRRTESLKQMAALCMTWLLVGQVIGYGVGFTEARDEDLFTTMYRESASGMRILGGSWRNLTHELQQRGTVEMLPILADRSGRRVAVDYERFHMTQNQINELYVSLHRDTCNATEHLNSAIEAANSLTHRGKRIVALLAHRYSDGMAAVSEICRAIDGTVELVLSIRRSILDQHVVAESLVLAQRLVSVIDEAEKHVRSAGLPLETIIEARRFAELLYSTALLRSNIIIKAALTRSDGNYTLRVRLTYPTELKILDTSVCLLPETIWLIHYESLQTTQPLPGVTILEATVTKGPGDPVSEHSITLVIFVLLESIGQNTEAPFVVPITVSP